MLPLGSISWILARNRNLLIDSKTLYQLMKTISICFRFWYPDLTTFLENVFLIIIILCIELDFKKKIQHFRPNVFNLYIFSFSSKSPSLLLANIAKKHSCWYKYPSSLTPVEIIASQLCGVYFLVGSLVLLSPGAAGVSSDHFCIQRWPREHPEDVFQEWSRAQFCPNAARWEEVWVPCWEHCV